MNPPHLLLDVDGVLIPFPGQDGRTPASHVHHEVVPTGRNSDEPVPIWLDPRHGPMIRDLIETRLVTPAWCTSWRHDAPDLIGRLLSLPPFPFVDLPRPRITTSHPNGYLWKRDHVDAWLADAPAVWIDDDFTSADHVWALRRTAAGIPTLLVQPDPYVGLRPEHLLTAVTWAARAFTVGNTASDSAATATREARTR